MGFGDRVKILADRNGIPYSTYWRHVFKNPITNKWITISKQYEKEKI
jgi:hypothetical protein